MSWNLHFELKTRSGAEVPESVRRMAGERLCAFVERAKHAGLAHFEPSAEAPVSGFIQILLREGSESDYLAGLRVLQSIARTDPDLIITAMDELYLTDVDVREVDADQLLNPDEAHGAGRLRAAPDPRAGVIHHEVGLDSRAVARELLSALEKRKLIEWCGDPQSTVDRIAALADRVGKGQWQEASAVLAILETEESVSEVFATDRQLDALWRAAISRG